MFALFNEKLSLICLKELVCSCVQHMTVINWLFTRWVLLAGIISIWRLLQPNRQEQRRYKTLQHQPPLHRRTSRSACCIRRISQGDTDLPEPHFRSWKARELKHFDLHHASITIMQTNGTMVLLKILLNQHRNIASNVVCRSRIKVTLQCRFCSLAR